jgi:hypothetical protein
LRSASKSDVQIYVMKLHGFDKFIKDTET